MMSSPGQAPMPICQALVAAAAGRFELREVTLAKPGVGQVLVETLVSVMSPGTERRRTSGAGDGNFPFVPGYSCSVRVVDPNGAPGLAEGDIMISTGTNAIEDVNAGWGAHCAMQVLPADRLLHVPDGVTPLRAAANKLAAIAHHGVVRAGLAPGERVLLVGLGLLGQFCARLAAPKCELTCVDTSKAAVATARTAGLDASLVDVALQPAIGEHAASMDVVFDVTGVPTVPGLALTTLKDVPWGATDAPMPRYVIQGSYGGDVVIPYQPAFMKEMVTILPRDNGDDDRKAVLSLLAADKLRIDDLLADVREPAQAPAAFEALNEGRLGSPTVAFDWAGVVA